MWVHLIWWHLSLDAFQTFLFVFGFWRFDYPESSGSFCVCVSWSLLNLLWVCWIWRSILKNKIWGVWPFFWTAFVLFADFSFWGFLYIYVVILGGIPHVLETLCIFLHFFLISSSYWILSSLLIFFFFFHIKFIIEPLVNFLLHLLNSRISIWFFFYNFSLFLSFYILYLVNHCVHTFLFSLNTDSFISLTIFIIVTLNFFKFCIWTPPLEFLLMALFPEYCSQCFHVSLHVSYFIF